MNRDEYVVELERSVEESFEEAKLKIKEKRNSAERTGFILMLCHCVVDYSDIQ